MMNNLKKTIENIPFLGWLFRWCYNILKINNTTHEIHSLKQKLQNKDQEINKQFEFLYNVIQEQKEKYDLLLKCLDNTNKRLDNTNKRIDTVWKVIEEQKQKLNKLDHKQNTQEQFAYDLVRKQIVSQLLHFNEKLDTLNLTSLKRIFVDTTSLSKNDMGTGIDRVVKEQLKAFEQIDQNEFEIIPVSLKSISPNTYHILHSAKEDDIFYSADLSYENIQQSVNNGLYDELKKKGIKIVHLIHDLLPISHPQFFALKDQKELHQNYIKNIALVSDILITTTEVGKKELSKYLKQNNLNTPQIEAIHLGSNSSKKNIEQSNNSIIEKSKTIDFLIVGTIEPRKAHAQIIQAFDLLWNTSDLALSTQKLTLHIVGKKGWLVDDTMNIIYNHPLLNKNLFYYDYVDDEKLHELYSLCDSVIVGSYAEGFGLPLIEAASYTKPIIARDIEVFREVIGDYPFYFKNTEDPQDIAEAILRYTSSNFKLQTLSYENYTWNQHIQKVFQILK